MQITAFRMFSNEIVKWNSQSYNLIFMIRKQDNDNNAIPKKNYKELRRKKRYKTVQSDPQLTFTIVKNKKMEHEGNIDDDDYPGIITNTGILSVPTYNGASKGLVFQIPGKNDTNTLPLSTQDNSSNLQQQNKGTYNIKYQQLTKNKPIENEKQNRGIYQPIFSSKEQKQRAFLPKKQQSMVFSEKNSDEKIQIQDILKEDDSRLKRSNFIAYKRKPIQSEYQIKQKLGQGGFSKVFCCSHLKSRTQRIVKIIKKEKTTAKHHKEMIKKQIQFLKILDHPNIIKIYQVFENRETFYFVMQKCEGGTLKKYISSSSSKCKLKKDVKKQILRQIFYAVNYLHQNKIIHRDLKPENIMLVNSLNEDSRIEDIDVKIIDFGLSTSFEKQPFKTWTKIGTAYYMAPQIFNGIYSTKGDVWSCGVIMHLLLLGTNPFYQQNDEEIQKKIKNYELDQHKKWSSLDQDEKYILTEMLQKFSFQRKELRSIISHQYFESGKASFLGQRNKRFLLSKTRNFPHKRGTCIDFFKYFLLTNKISQEKRRSLGRLFSLIDKDRDGVLSETQFKDCFPQQILEQEVQQLFSKIDLDNSKDISFSEFIYIMSAPKETFSLENIVEIYDTINTQEKGAITYSQMKMFFWRYGKKNYQVVQKMFNAMNLHKNGTISKEQFVFFILKHGVFYQQ